MKRKIGKLYNKTIIEGDINLKTPNEIHKNELSKGGDQIKKFLEVFRCEQSRRQSNDPRFEAMFAKMRESMLAFLNQFKRE